LLALASIVRIWLVRQLHSEHVRRFLSYTCPDRVHISRTVIEVLSLLSLLFSLVVDRLDLDNRHFVEQLHRFGLSDTVTITIPSGAFKE
jgi:hypothetical protein